MSWPVSAWPMNSRSLTIFSRVSEWSIANGITVQSCQDFVVQSSNFRFREAAQLHETINERLETTVGDHDRGGE